MTVRRMVRRTLVMGVLALLCALAGSATNALAAPAVTIESPASGFVTGEQRPAFSGHTDDPLDNVTVGIYAGSSLVESAQALPEALTGAWSVQLSSSLSDGDYGAVAEQTESETSETGFSNVVEFTVDTKPPKVTLSAVASPTNDTSPSFSGTASDTTGITVYVFKGGSAGGSVVAEAHASGTGAGWSSGGASPALPDGTYTAVAEQTSSLGNEPGFSQERTFTVVTEPPTVTLNPIASPTNDSTPSFSGFASDTTGVTVYIFKGGSASGSPVSTAHANSTGGSWSSGGASPSLPDGSYTAVAVQESSVGNGEGSSEPIHFAVNTAPPAVSLNPIASPTNDNTPAFSGFATDTTPVTVYIFKGASAGGTPAATAQASGTGGAWSSGEASPALPDGSYTAVAAQPSSLGNPEGASEAIHFTVSTAPPKVTLNSVKSPSGNTTPTFGGTASDTTPVTIQVYAGSSAEGTIVATAGATGTGGSWTSGQASPALPSGTYTAVAEQESSLLGNPTGVSNPVTFVVDTSSPTVTVNSIPTPSNNATPSFKGTATDTTPVVVHVFDGGNHEVASASASPSGGSWKTTPLGKALSSGSYSAIATEISSLGNPEGKSSVVSFTVNTESPHVTLNQPAKRSNVATPSFGGTASEGTPVRVFLYKGSTASGSPVATLEAAVGGGVYTTGPAPALADGTYTAVAVEQSAVENPPGFSQERVFEVDTAAPAVTLTSPPARSNNTKPSFTGTASETTPVTILVYKGISASGTPVATAQATGTGGEWTSSAVNSALVEGTYTAIALQESSLSGNPTGVSNAATFVVETHAPVVTLKAVPSPTNERTPTFQGTATDTTPVVVDVFAGESASGTPLASATATEVTKGAWSAKLATALPEGEATYTAVAREESPIGNGTGRSEPTSFVVDTRSPELTLLPPSPLSNNRNPSFSGTASDHEPVVVHVYTLGPKGERQEVSHAEATPSGGKWKSGSLSSLLAEGETRYTAVATQQSSLGNPEGTSAEAAFVVDTNPPTVTMELVPTPSNNIKPTFSGAASDTEPVRLQVTGGGKKYEATATVNGGKWSASITLPSVESPYKAVAVQASSLGNAPGKSNQIEFVVAPRAPTVTMTAPKAQLDTSTPTFTGTASDSTPVTVAICFASTPCGAEAGQWTAKSATGGSWSATAPSLKDGEYQAIASQKSRLFSEELPGATGAYRFTVDTVAPFVAITSPPNGASAQGSSQLVQGSAGTAPHDVRSVVVELYSGSSIAPGQAPVQSIGVGAPVGGWQTTLRGLAPGSYTVRSVQSDEAGNVRASGAMTFTMTAPPVAAGPAAAFTWYPAKPHTGEAISLVSTSTDETNPITGYAWDLLGTTFTSGGQTQTTSFSSPGSHPVQLRITDAAGQTSVASEQIPVTYPLMRPFPVVRIVTTRSIGRVRLKVLSVQAPVGASVAVTCSGKGCPLKSQTTVVKKAKASGSPTLALTRFERSLAPGVVMRIRISKTGQIGKYTSFTIRRGKLPVRSDECVSGQEPKLVPCSP